MFRLAASTVGRGLDPARKPPLLGEGDRDSGGRVGMLSFCLCTPISLSAHKETGVRLQRKALHPHRLLPQTLPLKGEKLSPRVGFFLISTAVVQADSRFSIYQGGTTFALRAPPPAPSKGAILRELPPPRTDFPTIGHIGELHSGAGARPQPKKTVQGVCLVPVPRPPPRYDDEIFTPYIPKFFGTPTPAPTARGGRWRGWWRGGEWAQDRFSAR